MNDIQIITEFKEHVKRVYPQAEIYFYGSRAYKTHRVDSDYDVLVVLDEVNPKIRDTVYDIAWEISFKHDAFISPVIADKNEFVRFSASPFFSNVKQHGLVI